jgi:hypothetical protein
VVGAGQRGLADFFRLLRSTAKKGINPGEAGAGDDILGRDPAVSVEEPAPELDLALWFGAKSRYGRPRQESRDNAVFPNQTGNPEAGAGAENDAWGVSNRLSRM